MSQNASNVLAEKQFTQIWKPYFITGLWIKEKLILRFTVVGSRRKHWRWRQIYILIQKIKFYFKLQDGGLTISWIDFLFLDVERPMLGKKYFGCNWSIKIFIESFNKLIDKRFQTRIIVKSFSLSKKTFKLHFCSIVIFISKKYNYFW